MSPINILWLKRDLRWQDHDALSAAFADKAPLLALFCFEPCLEQGLDFSPRHRKMQEQALFGMKEELGPLADHLLLVEGNADQILEQLGQVLPVQKVFAHREHGLKASYERDKSVSGFCKAQGIQFIEFDHNGVQRGRRDRLNWDEDWRNYMQMPLKALDLHQWPHLSKAHWNEIKSLKLKGPTFPDSRQNSQRSLNRTNSVQRLNSFLENEAQGYQRHIGEPQQSLAHCSRLSVALAWGTLSLREIYQASLLKHQEVQRKSDLRAFLSRLHWHSHFIQKFEMEMRMEFENINRGYDRIRQAGNLEYFELWKAGQTGIPLVDACMRAVQSTGYLNFRMRAMVVSFWSHILWQPWQLAVHHLAQCFSDYIPGIHYPQFQMQSSVTGINTIRVYNPIKQALEKDPDAVFISKWLPELGHLPVPFRLEPWKLSAMEQRFYGFELGRDYPKPMVDVSEAANFARDELWKMKQDPLVRVESRRIVNMHTAADRNIQRRTQKIISRKAKPK